MCRRRGDERETKRGRHKGGELGEKAESLATWVVKEAGVCLVLSNKNIKSLVSLYFVRCHKNDFLSKKTESMIVLM